MARFVRNPAPRQPTREGERCPSAAHLYTSRRRPRPPVQRLLDSEPQVLPTAPEPSGSGIPSLPGDSAGGTGGAALRATVPAVGDLTPGSGGPPSRRSREQRAYRLAVTGGVAGAVAVIGIVLAAVNVFGWAVPILAALIAVICLVMFRRTVSA